MTVQGAYTLVKFEIFDQLMKCLTMPVVVHVILSEDEKSDALVIIFAVIFMVFQVVKVYYLTIVL